MVVAGCWGQYYFSSIPLAPEYGMGSSEGGRHMGHSGVNADSRQVTLPLIMSAFSFVSIDIYSHGTEDLKIYDSLIINPRSCLLIEFGSLVLWGCSMVCPGPRQRILLQPGSGKAQAATADGNFYSFPLLTHQPSA